MEKSNDYLLRKSEDRGLSEMDWLRSLHTFSFGEYHDVQHRGFSVLRVINEDWIAGGRGFDFHPHKDMEILTYVIDGDLEHRDSMGNQTLIRPGEIQRMSAGTGVTHSEYNHLKDRETHLLQIWIFPDRKGHTPSYGQMSFETKLQSSNFILLASNDGRNGSITMNQDAAVYLGKTKSDDTITHTTSGKRNIWIQMVSGQIKTSEGTLKKGDGAAFKNTDELKIQSFAGTEFLLFDLP